MNFWKKLNGELPRGTEYNSKTPEVKWGQVNSPEFKESDEWKSLKSDETDAIFIGYDEQGRLLGWRDDRHVFLTAANRAGKGISLIVPNLFQYNKSVMVIDPKGENARITMHRRAAMGQKVIILDPFNTTGLKSRDTYNPLALIDPENESEAIRIAGDIAASLIIGNKKDPYWTDKARALLKALILFVKMPAFSGSVPLFPLDEQNLGTVLDLFSLRHQYLKNFKSYDNSPRTALLEFMSNKGGGAYLDIVVGVANEYLGNDSDGAQSIFSTLGAQLEFLDDIELRAALSSSPSQFSFEDMKRAPTSVFLCLPASKMDTCSRWLRMLIRLALRDFEISHERLKKELAPADPVPVLMILDEFPILGHMKAVQSAAGYIAGFGVKMWFIVQNLGQLKEHYQQSWETFLGNSGITLFFGTNEAETLKYIAERLGVVGMNIEEARNINSSAIASGQSPIDEKYHAYKLLEPHEIESILERKKDRVLIKATGQPPLILRRARYYGKKDHFKKWDKA